MRASPKSRPVGVERGAGLLRGHRDFRLLWAGDTVSAVGDAITVVALPLVALESLHASTAVTAALTGVPYLSVLLLGLPVGAWVDRLPRRPVLLVSAGGAAVAVGSVPVAAAAGVLSLAQLVAVALLLGAARVVTQTASSAFLPEVVPRIRLVEANGALQASGAAAQIGGPGVAGVLVQAAGAPGALAADALSFVASCATLAAMRAGRVVRGPVVTSRPVSRRRAGLVTEVREGLHHVVGDPVLRVLTVNAAVANLSLGAADALTVPFLRRTLGLPPGVLGLVLALGSAGGVVGAASAGRLARRFGTGRLVLVGILATAPVGLLMALAAPGPRLLLFVVGLFVLCLGLGLYNVTVVSYRQAATPPALIGRVTAAMRVVQQGPIPLGAALGAGLSFPLGTRGALAVSLAIDVLPGLILMASPVRRMRDLPVTAEPPAPDRLR